MYDETMMPWPLVRVNVLHVIHQSSESDSCVAGWTTVPLNTIPLISSYLWEQMENKGLRVDQGSS